MLRGGGAEVKLLSRIPAAARVLAPALLGALLAVSCTDGSSTVTAETENTTSSGGNASQASLIDLLPFVNQSRIAHSGLRQVLTKDWNADPPHTIRFREEVHSNGEGGYSILATVALEGIMPSWTIFQLLQSNRQGLLFRYRDFAIRDGRLFRQNWQLTSLGVPGTVAGRSCQRYLVEFLAGAGHSYTVSVDVQTGLILHYEEKDHLDRLLSSVTYETVDYAPDFSGVAWYDEESREQLSLTEDLQPQLGFDPLEPQLLPVGYERHEAEIAEVNGDEWLKLTYQDGVNSLFFLQRFPFLERRDGSASSGGTRKLVDAGDTVSVYHIGAATVLHGIVEGREIIAVGKVPEVELLDLLQSALH